MNQLVKKIAIGIAMNMAAWAAMAQSKIDEERMQRDIEVAENILSTLLRQQLDKRSFFPVEINGSYLPGYGVNFKLPYELTTAWFNHFSGQGNDVQWLDGQNGSFSFSFSEELDGPSMPAMPGEIQEIKTAHAARVDQVQSKNAPKENEVAKARAGRTKKSAVRLNGDSLKEESSKRVIQAAKDFLADYGDLIGQLSPTERITITNRGEGERVWFGAFTNNAVASYISVEALKSDLTQFRQGKLTREQLFAKVKVVNSKMDDELQPDLELLTSIFNRLYHVDLSKNFFTQENTYYERLKDYGVIYYMEVYSSSGNSDSFGINEEDFHYAMPTLGLEDVDQETRDKKVKELYPLFENGIKEDMLEYGRTLKSLKPEELLVFNIKLTRCRGCAIPATLEIAIKDSVLKEYASGKISKEAALAKISVKQGANQ